MMTYKLPPVFIAAVLSFLIFFLSTIFFSFPFAADDYSYLTRIYSPEGFSFSSFGSYIYRVPLWCLFTWGLFHLAPSVPFHLFMYIAIFLYLLAFALLTYEIMDQLDGSQYRNSWALIAVTIVFSLYPSHYEVLYWPTCMSYIPGLLFIALAFRLGSPWWKVFFFASSFLTSEMYVLPALAFLNASSLKEKNLNLKTMVKRSRCWIAAILLTFGIKALIHLVAGLSFRYDLVLSPSHLLSQLKMALLGTWMIHFYKINYLLSLLYISGLILAFYTLLRDRTLSSRFIYFFLASAILTTAIFWPFGHLAYRALFGSQIYILTILSFVLVKLKSKIKYFLAFFFLIFTIQNFRVYSIKDKNYHVLEKRSAELIIKMQSCLPPCVLEVSGLNEGLRRDWVLHPDYWEFFIQWLHKKHFPDKDITFKIIK
jgi:hypothetical protein